MKLHHLDDNGKQSFAKKHCLTSYINDFEHLPPVTTGCTSDIDDSFDDKKHSLDASQDNQPAELDHFSNRLISLYDRVGRPHFHDFTTGNICIFGDGKGEVKDCSIRLLSSFARIGYEVEVIDIAKVTPKILQNSDAPALIKVDRQIPRELMKSIIQSCKTICVLKLKGSEIICSLNSRVKSNSYTKKLIDSLGGNLHLRRLMIASLAEDEFLLIENTPIDQRYSKGTVRCFQTIIKHHAESLSQIG